MFVLMPEAGAARTAPPLEMIQAMTACAFELGQAAAGIAKRAGDDTSLFLAASAEFRQCFFAVRMGIRLKMSNFAAAGADRAAPAAEAPQTKRERPEAAEAPDWGGDDRLPAERERDRDYEPVSLPRFLKTLGLAATRAEAVRDQLPAYIRDTTLPQLRELLSRAEPPPRPAPATRAAAVAVLNRPPAAPPARARLLASTVRPGALPIPPPPRRSG